jgi:hypothetical protein
VLEK